MPLPHRNQGLTYRWPQSINQATATQKPGAHLQEAPVNQSVMPLPHRNQGLTGNPNQPIKRPVYNQIQIRVNLNFVVVVHTRGRQKTAYLKRVDRDPCIYKGWTENHVPTRGGQRTEYVQGVDREPCTYKGWKENRVHTRGGQTSVYLQGMEREPCTTRGGQTSVYLQGMDRQVCT